MKYLIIIMTLIIPISSQVFRSYSSDQNYEKAQLNRNRDIIRTYYKSGERKSESVYHNNRLDGYSREYYKSGTIKSETYYKNGREDGWAYFYFESGILMQKTLFNRGRVKNIVDYDSTGSIVKVSEKIAK